MPIKPLTSAMTTRRQALKRALCASTVLVAAPGGFSWVQAQGAAAAPAAPTGPFKLPPLPYAYDALEPHIDAQTMQIHHDKHHATYVANLNKAVADNAALAARSVEDLVRNLNTVPGPVRDAVRNNAGGHLNHEFFWNLLKKNDAGPKGELSQALDKAFGSFNGFKTEFTKTALGVFGSGWAWLAWNPTRGLFLAKTPNQDSLLTGDQGTPLVGVDVWEHAYYLKYQNRRADYVAAFFNVINWDLASDRFSKLKA